MDLEVVWNGVNDQEDGDLLFPRFAGHRSGERPLGSPAWAMEAIPAAAAWMGKGQTTAVSRVLHAARDWMTGQEIVHVTGIERNAVGSVLGRLVRYGLVEITPEPITWHTGGRAACGYRWKS